MLVLQAYKLQNKTNGSQAFVDNVTILTPNTHMTDKLFSKSLLKELANYKKSLQDGFAVIAKYVELQKSTKDKSRFNDWRYALLYAQDELTKKFKISGLNIKCEESSLSRAEKMTRSVNTSYKYFGRYDPHFSEEELLFCFTYVVPFSGNAWLFNYHSESHLNGFESFAGAVVVSGYEYRVDSDKHELIVKYYITPDPYAQVGIKSYIPYLNRIHENFVSYVQKNCELQDEYVDDFNDIICDYVRAMFDQRDSNKLVDISVLIKSKTDARHQQELRFDIMQKFEEYFLPKSGERISKDFMSLYPILQNANIKYKDCLSKRVARGYDALGSGLSGSPFNWADICPDIDEFADDMFLLLKDVDTYHPLLKTKRLLFIKILNEQYGIYEKNEPSNPEGEIDKLDDASKNINQVSHRQVAASGGANSYKKYKPLKKKVEELCESVSHKVGKKSCLQICRSVAKIIESEHADLLTNFEPYIKYKNGNGDDWTKPTMYDWCRNYVKTMSKNLQ